MIIFGSILTPFESSSIFGGSWGSIEYWLKPKTKPLLENLTCEIHKTLCKSGDSNPCIGL